jgi:peptidoglycan/LPS O-acetylase OafA/YrhL
VNVPQLTFTRFLAALLVVLFHYGKAAYPFNEGMLHHFVSEGAVAVSFFFVLSGLVLALVYEPQMETGEFSTRKFFTFRFARIAPLYYLAFALTLLAWLPYPDHHEKIFPNILQALGIHAWVPGYSLDGNYTSWSVSVEFFFYLCFPFLLVYMRKLPVQKLLLLSILFWAASQAGHIFLKSIDNGEHYRLSQLNLYHPLALLSCFTSGMAAGLLIVRRKTAAHWPAYFSIPAVLLSATAIFFILATDNFICPWVHNGLLVPLFLLLLCGLIYDRSSLSKILSLAPFIWLGEISYGIYLLQHPVEVAMRPLLEKIGTPESSLRLVVYLLALIAASALIYHLFEKPARKFIRNLFPQPLQKPVER